MTDQQAQRLERLVMAAVTAALVFFGGAKAKEAGDQEKKNLQVLADYREFIYFVATCECPDD